MLTICLTRICCHGYEIIPTMQGPTGIEHIKNPETAIQWCVP